MTTSDSSLLPSHYRPMARTKLGHGVPSSPRQSLFPFLLAKASCFFLLLVLFHELLVFCKFKRGTCFLQFLSFLPASKDAGFLLVVFCFLSFKGFTANYQDTRYNRNMEKLKRLFNSCSKCLPGS